MRNTLINQKIDCLMFVCGCLMAVLPAVGATVNIDAPAGQTVVSEKITGNTTVIVNADGSGTVVLNGASDYTGNTTLVNGTLKVVEGAIKCGNVYIGDASTTSANPVRFEMTGGTFWLQPPDHSFYIANGAHESVAQMDKAAGAPSGKAKRNNMLSFFTYYSDGTHPVRQNAGHIEISDCTSDDTDRLLHYNYGNEKWQRGKPMTDITFRNVRATRIKMPISLWGDREVPVRLIFKDCEIGYSTPQPEFIRGAYISAVELDNVKVFGGVDGPLVRLWHAEDVKPVVRAKDTVGVAPSVCLADTDWSVRGI